MPKENKKEKKVPGRKTTKVIKEKTAKIPQYLPGNRDRIDKQES